MTDAKKIPVYRSDDKRPKPRRCRTCGHTEGTHQPRFRYPSSTGCRKCYCTKFVPREETK